MGKEALNATAETKKIVREMWDDDQTKGTIVLTLLASGYTRKTAMALARGLPAVNSNGKSEQYVDGRWQMLPAHGEEPKMGKCRDCKARPVEVRRSGKNLDNLQFMARCYECGNAFRAKREANRVARAKRLQARLEALK